MPMLPDNSLNWRTIVFGTVCADKLSRAFVSLTLRRGIPMFIRKNLLAVVVASAFATPAAVLAQTPAPAAPASDHTFTANVALASQYIFRGLTQTNEKPAIQGGFDYSHASGVYVGTWLSNINWFTDQNIGGVAPGTQVPLGAGLANKG